MRRAAVQLGEQDTDRCCTLRDLDAEQLLDCHGESQLIVKRRQIVHPGDVGAALGEGELLSGLFHPGVEVANDRLGAADDLAFQLDLEAEHPVGRGVLRPHVEDHALVLVDPVVEHVIVLDHPTELLVEPRHRLVLRDLLLPLVGWAEFGLLGARHPEVDGLGALVGLDRVAHLN